MLRTLFVGGIIIFGFTYSWKGPFYALLFYLWIAYFRPEAWLWSDYVSSINLSLIMGTFVLVATLLSQKERFRGGKAAVLMFLFLAQTLLATLLSPELAYSWPHWVAFAKCMVISFLIVTLVTDERRLRLALLVIAVSLGFEGSKQGWAQLIRNPGGLNANEIPMLGDNNGVAVGMLMLVPILLSVGRTASSRMERWIHRFVALGVLYRAISTYSRGGFLACGALGLHYFLRSNRKIAAVAAIALSAAIIVPVLPPAFWERMETIGAASQDAEGADKSIKGRLHFWEVAVVMAGERPLTGVGVFGYNAVYDRYDFLDGEYGTGRSVHSMWFGLLSEVGYPGLIIFLALLGYAFRSCWRARRLAKRDPAFQTLAIYATAIEAGFIVAAVGGAFVIYQYCELLWHWLALAIALGEIVSAHEAALAARPAPVTSQPLAAVRNYAASVQPRPPVSAHAAG